MKELNVLYLSDNNYAAYAGVSILSMFENNKHVDKFHVYIIDDSIAQDNKDKLQGIAKKYGHEVIFLDLTEGIRTLERMGIPKYRNTYTTYLKLFTFNLFPDDVKRVFFIDSDTVIVDDLSEMVDLDMQGYMIASVGESLAHPEMVALGYDTNDHWYNMGVFLIDVDAWKADHAQDKIIAQLQKRRGYFAVDQDLINITQHGNILPLHPRYNVTPHHYIYKETAFRRAFPQNELYDLETMQEAREHPAIRHFERFLGQSAWNKNTPHPYAPLFDKYLALSPWKDMERKKANLSPTMKIENLLYHIMPHDLFVYVFAWGFRRYIRNTNKKFEKDEPVSNIV